MEKRLEISICSPGSREWKEWNLLFRLVASSFGGIHHFIIGWGPLLSGGTFEPAAISCSRVVHSTAAFCSCFLLVASRREDDTRSL